MNPEALFTTSNVFALAAWLPLIVAPRWRHTMTIARRVVPVVLGCLYVYLVVANLGEMRAISALREVSSLFQKPALMLAGWIHYLIFDLFIGSWELEDAIRAGISHWALIPCLALTNLFGPIGLLMYLVIRWTVVRAR